MENINDLFDDAITTTIDAYPSIFSKDDVVNLLSNLRSSVLVEAATLKPTVSISEMDFQEFSSNVCKALEREINNGGLDVYDYSSAEFSINYHNTIEIENLDFNTDAVTNELSNILLDRFQESFGKFITSEDE